MGWTLEEGFNIDHISSRSLNVKVLGAAGEVGRSGFLVTCGRTNLLLDYGIKTGKRGDPPEYPSHVKPRDIDGIIITHAHLDHSAFVPSLFVSGNTDVYATPPTIDLSKLLIEDMLKIGRDQYPFDIRELNNMLRNTKEIGFRHKITKGDAKFELRESGHVIGGSTILVESEGKRLFYTGDIKTGGSRMVQAADLDIGDIDLLITESTYSQTKQTPRIQSEQDLVDFANEIVGRGGILFIPSFSVERSQNIACTLYNANFKHKVIMDGMALKVNEIIFRHSEYLRDPKIFADAINRSTAIKTHAERVRAVKEPCVVISPAGMLVGGNAVYYLQELAFDRSNGIALVSYQGEGTPGRRLIDAGKVFVRGRERDAQAEVRQFEFSGHADRDELFAMISKIQGNPKVLTVHGDAESCDIFAREIHEEFGFDAQAAKINQTVTI